MEKRKDILSATKVCRFCLAQNEPLRSLYDRIKEPKNTIPLSLKILSCVSIEVFPSDRMPSYICNRCRFFMDLFYGYKQICRDADETILQYVQTGTALEPIVWSPSLTKMFRSGAKDTTNVGVMKTVVEGGAMIEVTSHEMSDSEEGDANVYNVKIGEGSNEGSTCIKVVTSKDDQQDSKKKLKGSDKGFSSMTKLARHVRTHASERAYPCKYCSKTFIKSHHYTRHLRLKHRDTTGPFSVTDQYRCEQCEDTFGTQDDLIYHSAIHATQNLTCPLCQEKFKNVDAVTAHIKSHVNGEEFQCDYCELVFTSKEKLDGHINAVHDDEIRHQPELGLNDSSMEIDAEEDDDDNTINLKEEDDHMVVEIKKADEFMLPNLQADQEEKIDNTNSEESESEVTYTDLATVNTLAIVKQETLSPTKAPLVAPVKLAAATFTPKLMFKTEKNIQTASILRKAEEMKRKVVQHQSPDSIQEKKEKPANKVESNSIGGASDKSLRLLEKELQELKRTTSRNDVSKTPSKTSETLRSSRRPQLHTSSPKPRFTEEKKPQTSLRSSTVDKKVPERRAIKENKEPKEGKEAEFANVVVKKERESKTSNQNIKEEKDKDAKENDTSMMSNSVVKNGSADKSGTEEGVRRSTRPSKVKDYAKMIRDRTHAESDDDSEDDDEEYVENEKVSENRPKTRRSKIEVSSKPQPKTPKLTPVRKRGRPRKDQPADVPAKIKKDDNEDDEDIKSEKVESEENCQSKEDPVAEEKADIDTENKNNSDDSNNADGNKTPNPEQKPSAGSMLVSPTGQTLKKVPIKALPPGVKPLPLPANARPMGPGELCEMQIGKKVVKVQKIVMTKAEVEAMAKKGLVEMKDGTMVLKQGIKIPTSDPVAIKSSLVGEEVGKESPSKKDKATPTRCDLGEES